MTKASVASLALLLVVASSAGSQTMPTEVARQLAAFGTEFDGEIAAATAKIYASQPRVYKATEIKVTHGTYVFVAIDQDGKPRQVPPP